MNAVNAILRILHHDEGALAQHLRRVGERHRTDHDVYHLARDVACWSEQHTRRLAEVGRDHGLDLSETVAESLPIARVAREKLAETIGRRPEPGLLLLHDLRSVYLAAAGNSIHWEMLGQAAQASRDSALLDLVGECRPQTVRQTEWAETMIKNLSAQILTSV